MEDINMYSNNTQSRKWLFTIQNPTKIGLTADYVHAILQGLLTLAYYCFCTEIASTGQEHMHIFIFSTSPIRFSTAKRRFPTAHIDKANGSCLENRTYLLKQGKWADTCKAETSVPGSFHEWGEMPSEGKEKNPAKAKLIEQLEAGLSTVQIIKENNNFAFKSNDINVLRETLLADKYMMENRDVNVTYIYGDSGVGKTRFVYDKHSPLDICRITNYGNKLNSVKFDAYHGQRVLVLDEYHSQIPLPELLNLLDIYPLYLPARYNDRVACYRDVYLISNIPLEAQYTDYQIHDKKTWNAFIRRISSIKELKKDDFIVGKNKEDYVL